MNFFFFFLLETELQGQKCEEGGQKLTNSCSATSLHSSSEHHSPCSLWNDGSLDRQCRDSAEKAVCRFTGWVGGGGVRGDSLSYITLGDLLFSIRLCVPARCYALCPLDQNRSASASADSESVICWMVEEQEPLAVWG